MNFGVDEARGAMRLPKIGRAAYEKSGQTEKFLEDIIADKNIQPEGPAGQRFGKKKKKLTKKQRSEAIKRGIRRANARAESRSQNFGKIPKSLKNKAKSFGIRLTTGKVGNRKRKSEKTLRKQVKNAEKRK